jgi:predicted ATPase/DNA-binding XRE family transcriptional regulator
MQESTFGEWLRKKRRSLDLSRPALAKQVGCAEITLRRIESGSLKPSRELARLLVEQAGVPEAEQAAWVQFARGLAGQPGQATEPVPEQENRSSNLPVYLTSFVGRTHERAELAGLLERQRLVTLTGPGGVGKTRLAGKAGEEALDKFTNGVWMAELASQASPELVPQTVAAAFSLSHHSQASPMELLVNYLRPRSLLLILDNCEHLSEACAHLAETLLKACPNLKILATSREPLNVMGEAVYHVPSLGIPDEPARLASAREFASIQLFEGRASLAQSDFSLTRENIPFVVQVCRRLDGIPMAIELAAARLDVLSVEELARRLEESFDLLTNGSRTALPRQQTLRGSIEWSWVLLSPPEQSLLRRLSVFAGGWTLEAAEAVCHGEGLERPAVTLLMTSLAARSMVSSMPGGGRERRYRLHEMIRQFAQEQISEAETTLTRTRHLQYFLAFSERIQADLHGPQQLDWLRRLGEERDNLRTALDWALKSDLEAGMNIIGWLYEELDLCEALEWATQFLARPESHLFPQARARNLLAQSNYLWQLQQFNEALAAAQESLALFRSSGDRAGEFDSLMAIGGVLQFTEGMEPKTDYNEQALALARAQGDTWRQARALNGLGWDQRDHPQAMARWDEAVSLLRQTGDLRSLAFLLGIYGDTLLAYGESGKAQPLLDESLQLNQRLNDRVGMEFLLVARSRQALLQADYPRARAALLEWIGLAEELGNRMGRLYGQARLGYVALCEGRLEESRQVLSETARKFAEDENSSGLAFTLERLLAWFARTGQPEKAVQLYGWADAIRTRTGDIRPPVEQAALEDDLAACRSKLGKDGYAKAIRQGASLTRSQALALALQPPPGGA